MPHMEGVSAGLSVLLGAQLAGDEVHCVPALACKMVAHPEFQPCVVAGKVCGHIESYTQFASVPPSPVPMLVSVAPSWPVILVTAITVWEFSEPGHDQVTL